MNDAQMARAFALEAVKRQVEACTDLHELRHAVMNLLFTVEAQKEVMKSWMLNDLTKP
jgi:hypothetical protein